MADSETAIANLALQKLGAKRIADIDEDSVNARACRAVYTFLRDGEFRKHIWSFAIRRMQLAEEASPPSWGKKHAYQLPSDFVRLAPDYEEDNFLEKDWVIEGKLLYTDDSSPLKIRYVSRITDTSQHDSLFDLALSAKMAEEMCEQLTQSNTKKDTAMRDYERAIAEAKRVNGIERRSENSPDTEWITRRQ